MEEIPNFVRSEWSWFYDATEWDDARWEVFRLRLLIAFMGESDDLGRMPEWQYPYAPPEQEDVRDTIKRLKEVAKAMKEKEAVERIAAKAIKQ